MASLINIFWRFLSVMFRVDQNLLHSHESIVHTYTYVCTRTLPTPNMSRLSNICDSCEFEIFAFSLALSSSWLGVFDSRRLGECREQPRMRSPLQSRGQVSLLNSRTWTKAHRMDPRPFFELVFLTSTASSMLCILPVYQRS